MLGNVRVMWAVRQRYDGRRTTEDSPKKRIVPIRFENDPLEDCI